MRKYSQAATINADDIADIWVRFKTIGDRSIRNRLIEHYLPIVKYNADRISAKLPEEVDRDDLASAGVFGLVDAIEAFDPDRGVKFETYCAPRIRGAILDELRTMDWVPRLVRSRAHQLQRATQTLEAELGRHPSMEELSQRMKLPKDAFDKLIRDANAVSMLSLSRAYSDSDSNKELREIDILEDREFIDPADEMLRRDLKEFMNKGLTRAERLVMVLYYYEEMTMKEIGASLDLSESRVSQMHSSIMLRLRKRLEAKSAELISA